MKSKLYIDVKTWLVMRKLGVGTCWWPFVRHQLGRGVHGHTVVCSRCCTSYQLTKDYKPRDCRVENPLPSWRYVMKLTRQELAVAWGGLPDGQED